LTEALDALMRPPAPDDLRTPAQRRADALVDLARGALAQGELPTVGGHRPQVGVLLNPATLLYGPDGATARTGDPFATATGPTGGAGGAAPPGTPDEALASPGTCGGAPEGGPPGTPGGALTLPGTGGAGLAPPGRPGDALTAAGIPPAVEPAWLNWYGTVPASVAQRIACDADLYALVLHPATGLPLYLGRTRRLVPASIRRALHARDRGCRWPGCSAPTPWSDAHHLHGWHPTGVTDVDNLVLLCRYHHVLVHEGRWGMRLDLATGEVHITTPDGQPYELGPSSPWTGPATRRGDLPDAA
jgi:hypothetical protein